MTSFDDIKKEALSLGWDDVRITKAEISQNDIKAYFHWTAQEFHGQMKYMENELRCYPEKLLEGVKTAIMFVSYYKQPSLPFRDDAGLVASYARGKDYHNIHRKRLKKFISWLEQQTGKRNIARGFSDSLPILEKALAAQAGLGWIGKNTLLIHPKFGSFILLSGVLTTLDLPYEQKTSHKPRCGSCQKCIQNCPSQALREPYCLDARRCLAYHLIESKNKIPEEIRKKNPGYIFGCDICQSVCPHNKSTIPTTKAEFSPQQGIGPYIDQEQLKQIKKNPALLFGTALKRGLS
jgi:epoxyqueuosine reductase